MGVGRLIQCRHCDYTEHLSLSPGFKNRAFVFLDEKTGYYTNIFRVCENKEDYETWWRGHNSSEDKFFKDSAVYQGRKMLILRSESDLIKHFDKFHCKSCGRRGFDFKEDDYIILWD